MIGMQADDVTKDVAPLLNAIAACGNYPQPVTTIQAIMAGTWKPAPSLPGRSGFGNPSSEALEHIQQMRSELDAGHKGEAFLRRLLEALVLEGYVASRTVKTRNAAHFRPTCRP